MGRPASRILIRSGGLYIDLAVGAVHLRGDPSLEEETTIPRKEVSRICDHWWGYNINLLLELLLNIEMLTAHLRGDPSLEEETTIPRKEV